LEPFEGSKRIVLTDLLPAELAEVVGVNAGEARRIYSHVVHFGHNDWAVRDMARAKLERLAATVELPHLEVVERQQAADGFLKYLFRLSDGLEVEAVRIPIFESKYTVCISSQAGCALGCVFCATGKIGFLRNLRAWEIVEQLRIVRAEADRPVRGVVFMGMGEPLLNYDNVVRAGRIMADPSGMAIAGRAITISTAGVVPAIRRFTADKLPFRLAISLTGATHEKRARLMPVENTWSLDELMDAVREHHAVTRERVMLEYVAISGVNCGADDAAALVELLRGLPVRFNIIEVNDASGCYQPPSETELRAFRDALQPLGQPIVRRYSGGKDVQAGCGMLAGRGPLNAGPRLPVIV
jgi:23S rRNA (adenine2503-C2)-methyltransferase